MRSPPCQHPFERKFLDGSEHRLIESRCVLCGFRIVGSAAEHLKEDEDGHVATCPRKKSNDATAGESK